MEDKNKKRRIAKITVFITSIFVIFMSVTYAFITQVLTGEKQVVVNAGVLDLVLEEENAITIENALPMYDEVGMIQEPFTFSLVNNGINAVDYILKLVDVTPQTVERKCSDLGEITLDAPSGCRETLYPDELRKMALSFCQYMYSEIATEDECVTTAVNDGAPFNTFEGFIDYFIVEGVFEDTRTLVNTYPDNVVEVSVWELYSEDIRYGLTRNGKNTIGSISDMEYTWKIDDHGLRERTLEVCKNWYPEVTDEASCLEALKDDGAPFETFDDLVGEYFWPNGGRRFTLDTGKIGANETINYDLRLWISEYVEYIGDIEGLTFSFKIDVEVSQEIEKVENKCITAVNGEDTSGAETPRLTSGMIPVVYDECEKKWLKADTSEAWYNYDTQNWANAVTVTENTRDTYMAMDAGEPISMDDINTMWVWIPRYEYQYTDLGTTYAGGTQTEPGEIKINFISSDTTTPSDSNTYKIPEGFTFGEENIPGFWMGKFETSTLESCTAKPKSINTACDLTSLTPQIKPNVTSWRGARVSTFFEASRLMQSSDDTLNYNADTYGFDATGTSSMDTHMLKNTEWGIVAMLSQSKYGKYGNENYTGAEKEVARNNCSSYITGIGGDTVSDVFSSTTCTTNTYETSKGQTASTAGTIYGVYDMSGGAWEYVMGNYNNMSGYNKSNNSGFCGTDGPTENCREWPNAKYYDLYTSSFASTGYKFGDGTHETSNWYSDYADFVRSNYPWFLRGGNASADAGIFSPNIGFGTSDDDSASRFVIKP